MAITCSKNPKGKKHIKSRVTSMLDEFFLCRFLLYWSNYSNLLSVIVPFMPSASFFKFRRMHWLPWANSKSSWVHPTHLQLVYHRTAPAGFPTSTAGLLLPLEKLSRWGTFQVNRKTWVTWITDVILYQTEFHASLWVMSWPINWWVSSPSSHDDLPLKLAVQCYFPLHSESPHSPVCMYRFASLILHLL